ncbi:Phosphatidylinositol kinase [Phytophthora megakarya]|uniref:Phosphatidylinositol kinase n=1 Tax=Phytophthora megakarya TaxID=4795 RepID=A0A225X0X2_9STRA|nr:Phosphatidylinositol kinase [Phytophthora megakarya]
MGTKCEGLVRIREQVVFRSPSSHESVDSASSSGQFRSVGRLSDDVWYFCVCRAPVAALEWFTVDAGTESSEDEATSLSASSDAVLLVRTSVSSVEAVNGESVKLPDEDEDELKQVLDDQERSRLENVSFYVEDEHSGIALLIETESQTHRDQWVQFLDELLRKTGQQEQNELQEAGEDAGEDTELLQYTASRASISMRSLLHQGKSENLMEEDDPFGLLSLTTSALSSMNPTDELSVKTSNAAPGMFAMDHFDLAEGNGHEEIEDTGDSDASSATADADSVADTAMDPSLLLSSGRGQTVQTRERSNSNVTDPLSSTKDTMGFQTGAKTIPTSELKRVFDEAGGLSRLVRWKYFDQGPKHEIEAHIRARSLGPLSLLSAMFKYRQQPFMFVMVLAQLVHNVENCLDTMDFYWPQFLQWGFVNLPDASPSVRAFYLFFLAATARRSVHLAVKATWECIAAHWDAMAGGFYKRGNGIVSLDGLKKKGTKISGVGTSLPKIFERACGRDPISGEHDSMRLESARANFVTSMAAYSLFSYIFLVKDRHNGNIMLDTEGHVVHIDFGFVLGIAPGNTFSLETAPFKLTPEMVEIMGAEGFDRYRQLVAQGLLALHLEAPQLLSLVYLSSKDAQDVDRTAARIVDKSNGHRGTRQYDWFQKISNGILP